MYAPVHNAYQESSIKKIVGGGANKNRAFQRGDDTSLQNKNYARRGTFLYDSLTGQRFCHWLTELSFLPDTYQRSIMGDD